MYGAVELEDARRSTAVPTADEFDVTVVCGPDGIVRFVSPSVKGLLGYETHELLGRYVRNFVEDDDWQRIEVLLPELTSSPSRVATVVGHALHRDGRSIELECILTNLLDVPAMEHIVLRLRRASTERLAFQELSRREHWFRSLLDALGDLIVVVDRDQRITYVNAAVEGIIGLAPSELRGAPIMHFVVGEDVPVVADALAAIQAGRPVAPITCRLQHQDGSEAWIEFVGTARIEDHEVHGIVMAARDMTQRRAVEERLRLLESAVTQLQDAVIVLEALDPRGVIFANPAACHLTGWTMEELIGQEASATLTVDRNDPGVLTLIEALVEQRTAIAEHELVRQDGSSIVVQTGVAPVVGADGATSHILAIMRDLTEDRRLEVELRHAQKLEAMGRLSAGIAHEINTPIQFIGDNVQFLSTAFSGVVELLGYYRTALRNSDQLSWVERKAKLDHAEQIADVDFLEAEVPRALEEAVEGIDRVATIVRAMKAFGHPDNAEQRSADLNEAIRNTLTVARAELKYVAEVVTDFGELPPVLCHLGDLNQVFLNLLVNASHAIAEAVGDSGDLGVITVRTSRETDSVVVSIADSGDGIPEEHRPFLFEPFFTTKEQGHGTGQGLALARTIVQDRHGGRIDYETEVGVGTTFSVHLPIGGRTEADAPL